MVVLPPATVAPICIEGNFDSGVMLDAVRQAVRMRPIDPPTPEPVPLTSGTEAPRHVAPWPDLSTMTVLQLRDRARELGVSLGKARTKAAIIEALGG